MNLKDLYKKRSLKEYIAYLLIILGAVALDQLTKWLAVKYLQPIDTLPIINGVIHLTYVENPGAAFGMMKGMPWIFNTISSIMIVVLSLYLFLGHSQNKLYTVALTFIIAGGIGNMIDRISLHYVVDFIDFRLINFAVFNGADSFVCVGAGFMMLALILDLIKEYKGSKNKTDMENER